MKKILLGAFACVAGGMVYAADGVLYAGGLYTDANWAFAENWYCDAYAKEGGTATVTVANFGGRPLNQDVSDLTLSGIYFTRFVGAIVNNPISFTGESPFLKTDQEANPSFSTTLSGTGENAFVKTGVGKATFDTPIANFTSFDILQGTVVQTNLSETSSIVPSTIPVNLKGGGILYAPNAATASDYSTSVGAVSYSEGINSIAVDRGSANSATLMLNSLSFAPEALLALPATDLGSGNKIKVAGAESSAVAPGAVFVKSSDTDFTVAAYDADTGFVAGTPGAKITEDSTVDTDMTVSSVQVDNSANVTLNATVTVDNGVNPGLVYFANQPNTFVAYALSGEGKIDFGERHGMVVWGAPAKGTKFTLSGSEVTGSAGVSFMSFCTGNVRNPRIVFGTTDAQVGWTGPVRFHNVYTQISAEMFA